MAKRQPRVRVLLVPVREYRQLMLAFTEEEADDIADRWNKLEAERGQTGYMAVVDVHKLCTKPCTKGLRVHRGAG